MKKVVIEEISFDELVIRLSKLFEEILVKVEFKNNFQEAEYITREQTAKMLKISLPTLGLYTKSGMVTSYKFGKRVLYKSEEVKRGLDKFKTTSVDKYIKMMESKLNYGV